MILIVTVAVVAGVTSVVGAVTAYRAGNVLLARGSRSAASRPVAAFTALLLVVAGCTAWQALSRPHLTPAPPRPGPPVLARLDRPTPLPETKPKESSCAEQSPARPAARSPGPAAPARRPGDDRVPGGDRCLGHPKPERSGGWGGRLFGRR